MQNQLLFDIQEKITQCTRMFVHWLRCIYPLCETFEIILLLLRLFCPKGL